MLIVWLTSWFGWQLTRTVSGAVPGSRVTETGRRTSSLAASTISSKSGNGKRMKMYYISHEIFHYSQSITLHTKYYITHKVLYYSQSITLHTKYYITHKVLHYTQSVTLIINYYIIGGIDDLFKVWKW